MDIKYVLFDFDGTLVDSNDAVVTALHETSRAYRGCDFSRQELNALLGQPLHDQMRGITEGDVEPLVAFYREKYAQIRDEKTKKFEGIDALLIALKERGIRIGVVSNKGRNGIDHGLAMLDLEAFIDVSISKDDVSKPKPDPEGIFKALEGLGASADEVSKTLYVGDSGHDILTAQNATCRSVLVGWTIIDIEGLIALKPDYVIEKPHELLELLGM